PLAAKPKSRTAFLAQNGWPIASVRPTFGGIRPRWSQYSRFESKARGAGWPHPYQVRPKMNERRKAKTMNAHTSNRNAAELPVEQGAAVVARDRAADGEFYYSVETTGVYC